MNVLNERLAGFSQIRQIAILKETNENMQKQQKKKYQFPGINLSYWPEKLQTTWANPGGSDTVKWHMDASWGLQAYT